MLSADMDDDAESNSGLESSETDLAVECVVERSEVDRYLQLPQLDHITEQGSDVDILTWWRDHSSTFPHLSKMARQYLAHPCSSAGMYNSYCFL